MRRKRAYRAASACLPSGGAGELPGMLELPTQFQFPSILGQNGGNEVQIRYQSILFRVFKIAKDNGNVMTELEARMMIHPEISYVS